jgi:uracil-DNA glycosylase family protein
MRTAERTASPFVPETDDLGRLAEAVRACHGCELYRDATQAVFGTGEPAARVMLVGEQPGDAEDRAGEPFVGPAGRVLDEVLAQAGIQRSAAYVTNVVKHFRWKSTDTGARRLHQNPLTRHVVACSPWLIAELRAVRPQVLVALGATAGKALFGADFRVTEQHGVVLPWPPQHGPYAGIDVPLDSASATIHPSAVLRTRSAEDRRAAFDGMVRDLTSVAALLG